ncbi:Uncharacterized protein APZ42_008078 [Daphnia magna]|uniref:Uncharacterized protein n=1 Tax=Daphnia magna TaxID=35525 RepID=A0A162BTC8_9CRUS|nr:Uncharacterized protein APZ42_008078 [Daphnia magna]
MDEESESDSRSTTSTNGDSPVDVPLKVARVQDDSQSSSCEPISQHKSSSNKAKIGQSKKH